MYKSIILIGLYISFKTDWTVSKEEFLQIYLSYNLKPILSKTTAGDKGKQENNKLFSRLKRNRIALLPY